MEPGCVPGLTLGGKLKCLQTRVRLPKRKYGVKKRHLEAGDLSVEGLRGDGLDAAPEKRDGSSGALLSSSCKIQVNRRHCPRLDILATVTAY